MSKQVTIQGNTYDLPYEANHVAMDEDGRWWWHENDPKPDGGVGCWNGPGKWGYIKVAHTDWKQSLIKIEE